MTLRSLIIAVVMVVSTAASAQDQSPVVPAGELINAVVANELVDRVQQRKWMYVIEKRVGTQSLTEEQWRPRTGPVYLRRSYQLDTSILLTACGGVV